jgi:hypothetical protein
MYLELEKGDERNVNDVIKELMEEQARLMAYPIFVGAIAVAKSWTLVSGKYPFIAAMKEAKEDLGAIPERLRVRVEHLDIYMGLGHIFEMSDGADLAFRILLCCPDNVRWVRYPASRWNHNQYIMTDADAVAYIAKESFTIEELEWLWQLAQKMHVLEDKPVERRLSS